MLYVANAFSLGMLAGVGMAGLVVRQLNERQAAGLVGRPKRWRAPDWKSIVGHESTAAVFSATLGQEVEVDRATFVWADPSDQLLVGQYSGPRLPEGATELPEGATIRWYLLLRTDDPAVRAKRVGDLARGIAAVVSMGGDVGFETSRDTQEDALELALLAGGRAEL